MTTLRVARAEIRRLFRQPLPWLVLALGQGLLALWFFLLVVRYLEQGEQLAAAGVTVEIMVRYFEAAYWSVLLIAPVITMTSIAGERRDGMLRFLFSLPLGSTSLYVIKLAAVMTLACAHVVLVSVLPLTLLWGAPIDIGVWAGNVLGFVLLMLFHVTLGLFASALTRVPVASALLTLAVALVLWFSDWAARLDSEAANLARWSSLTRLRGFGQGLLVSADVAYFVILALALALMTVALLARERRLS